MESHTMSLESLLQAYGYPILFAGTFIEGETPLLLAGFLAHQGYFALHTVIGVAFLGSFSADQLFFFLGRTRGRPLLARHPRWHARAERAERFFARYGAAMALGFRFAYGLRTVSPFVMGMSGFSPTRFAILNLFGGVLWSASIALIAYHSTRLASSLLGDLRRYEPVILGGLLLSSAAVWLIYLVRRHRATARS